MLKFWNDARLDKLMTGLKPGKAGLERALKKLAPSCLRLSANGQARWADYLITCVPRHNRNALSRTVKLIHEAAVFAGPFAFFLPVLNRRQRGSILAGCRGRTEAERMMLLRLFTTPGLSEYKVAGAALLFADGMDPRLYEPVLTFALLRCPRAKFLADRFLSGNPTLFQRLLLHQGGGPEFLDALQWACRRFADVRFVCDGIVKLRAVRALRVEQPDVGRILGEAFEVLTQSGNTKGDQVLLEAYLDKFRELRGPKDVS